MSYPHRRMGACCSPRPVPAAVGLARPPAPFALPEWCPRARSRSRRRLIGARLCSRTRERPVRSWLSSSIATCVRRLVGWAGGSPVCWLRVRLNSSRGPRPRISVAVVVGSTTPNSWPDGLHASWACRAGRFSAAVTARRRQDGPCSNAIEDPLSCRPGGSLAGVSPWWTMWSRPGQPWTQLAERCGPQRRAIWLGWRPLTPPKPPPFAVLASA